MEDSKWYGARTVYRAQEFSLVGCDNNTVYEERVVLIVAGSFDEAMERAENEAEAYASGNGMEYLGFVNIFGLGQNTISDCTEVYSLMRVSQLEPNIYLNTFFDTGSERTK